MDEPNLILEGTWEEVRQHVAELSGKQVGVEVREPNPGKTVEKRDRLRAAERFRLARGRAAEIEAQIPPTSGPDSVALIREARAGRMYGFDPVEEARIH